MAKAKLSRRAQELHDEDEHIVKDYDPEVNRPDSPRNSDSDISEEENAGTEHYVTVGQSKLRQKEGVSLGPQYRGSRVSRKALEDDDEDENEDEDDEEEQEDEDSEGEEYDNPDLIDLEADEAEASDSEIDSDDAFAESDADRFDNFSFPGSSKPAKPNGKHNKRATAADFMSSDEEAESGGALVEDDDDDEGPNGVDLDDSEEDEDMDDGLDELVNGGHRLDDDDVEDDDSNEDDSEESDDKSESESDEEAEDPSAAKPGMVASSQRADLDKGLAIQQQRKTYDWLLNLRIRLQKALVAANTLPTTETGNEPESKPYEAAEEAAIKLLNTMNSLGDHLTASSRAGDKRKLGLDSSMSSEEIWEQLQEGEHRSSKSRDDRLEKWSRKVQSINVTTTRSLATRSKTLIDTLQEQLEDPERRLVKRTRVPRSCAPAQASKKVTEDPEIYDDADFYQMLLKELVDQRTLDSGSAQAGAVPSVMLTATKEARNRKNVDRKASKGRKMRFTVHEKLQNFMAPEDRRTWEQGAIDRFFGTLFGSKLELNEDESQDEDMSDADAEEAGLRLFRS